MSTQGIGLASVYKFIASLAAAILASVFPSQIVLSIGGLLLAAMGVDFITGIQAATEMKQPISPAIAYHKSVRKSTRIVTYLFLAWVASQIAGLSIKLAIPLAEPVGGVLMFFLGSELLSIMRNLSRAKNNVPILDKRFKRLVSSLNMVDDKPIVRKTADRKRTDG